MYLLFVDESGTHGDSHAFVLGGVALHEDDAARLQTALDELVIRHVGRVPVNLEEYELHAGEMRNAKKPNKAKVGGRPSVWATMPRRARLALLEDAYALIAEFQPADPQQPLWFFAVVLDAHFRRDDPQIHRERFAYEVLLNKFDLMLMKLRVEDGRPNRGLVVHDRRIVAEQDIQSWVTGWRAAAGDVGQLRNLADVPLFTDSRATRLIQVADLVAYALFRRYQPEADARYFEPLWGRFHRSADGQVHGLVHFTPDFGRGACQCESCLARA